MLDRGVGTLPLPGEFVSEGYAITFSMYYITLQFTLIDVTIYFHNSSLGTGHLDSLLC